jgi:hypothetical protein
MKFQLSALACALGFALSGPLAAQTAPADPAPAANAAATPADPGGRPAIRPAPKAKAINQETLKAMAVAAKTAQGRPAADPAKVEAVTLPALSADQIVARNTEARGGLAAWRKVQSMTMVGQLEAGRRRPNTPPRVETTRDPMRATAERRAALRKVAAKADEAPEMIKLPFKMEMKRPKKQRVELEVMGDTAVQVWDGSHGWKLRPYLGRREVEAFNADELKAAALQQDLDGPLIDHAAKGVRVELAGTERVAGRPTYKLKLTARDGGVRNVWVDGETFLDLRIDAPARRFDGKPRAVYTYMQSYRKVDGLAVPFIFETRVDGVRDPERIYVENVAFNAPLDDARFTKPQ